MPIHRSGKKVVNEAHVSFTLGYTPRHPKARCRGVLLTAGELRVGKAMINFADDASKIDGFEKLTADDQNIVKAAWESDFPIDEIKEDKSRRRRFQQNIANSEDPGNSEVIFSDDEESPVAGPSTSREPLINKEPSITKERESSFSREMKNGADASVEGASGLEDKKSEESEAEGHVGTDSYRSTFKFADENEERDWKRVMAYYMEYPDPLPVNVKWNAYHWAQFYASAELISVYSLGTKMVVDEGQTQSGADIAEETKTQCIAPMPQAQTTVLASISSIGNAGPLEPGLSLSYSPPQATKGRYSDPLTGSSVDIEASLNESISSGKRKVGYYVHTCKPDSVFTQASVSTDESVSTEPRESRKFRTIQTARKSCYVSPHVRERNRRQLQLRQLPQERVLQHPLKESSTKLLISASSSSPSSSISKEPEHHIDGSMRKTPSFRISSLQTESTPESSRSARTRKKQYIRKHVYEEMKREREMVIQSLKAHAQQEELRCNKRMM
ncbi:hypothetical protein C0995_005114 [Termitomyces sp. Mi166|nr:hypothetical protein C0995_005114 [Termitomyces sp. Mi166\